MIYIVPYKFKCFGYVVTAGFQPSPRGEGGPLAVDEV